MVFLLFDHSFLGRGVIMHCVTPVEPLLQCVSHTIFYQKNIPPLVPKFILRAECIQVPGVGWGGGGVPTGVRYTNSKSKDEFFEGLRWFGCSSVE